MLMIGQHYRDHCPNAVHSAHLEAGMSGSLGLSESTHCGLVMPHGIWHLGQLWFIMACHLVGAWPLPEPMLMYCQVGPISVNFYWKFDHFYAFENVFCKMLAILWGPQCVPGDNSMLTVQPGCWSTWTCHWQPKEPLTLTHLVQRWLNCYAQGPILLLGSDLTLWQAD